MLCYGFVVQCRDRGRVRRAVRVRIQPWSFPLAPPPNGIPRLSRSCIHISARAAMVQPFFFCEAGARFEEPAPWSFALPELVLSSVEDRLGSGPRFGGPSAGTLLMERPCTNDRSGPLLIDGRSQTAKSGFVDDAEPAISGYITIIGQRAASRSGHAPKRPPGFAQIPRRCPTSEAARRRYRRDQSSQSR